MHRYIINAYSFLIERLSCISARIDSKSRQRITGLMIFILCVLGILRHIKTSFKDMIHYTDSAAVIAGTAALLILLIVSADRYTDLKKIKINRLCLYGWLLCFTMAFIMAFINPVRKGYFAWSIISLVFSVPFVMIWAARDDFPKFCILLARVMTFAAGCFVIVNLLLVPFIKQSGDLGYSGLMSNPNGNGMICSALYAAGLFLLLAGDRPAPAIAVITGFCIAFCIVSDCRTAQIAVGLETIVGAVYCLECSRNTGKKLNTKKILLTCAVLAVSVLAASFILTEIGKMDLDVYAFDEPGAVTSEDGTGAIYNTLDQLSSSRVRIWREFLLRVTFWGNGSPDAPIMYWYDGSIYAHNNAIEILYTSGVLAFIGYTAFLLCGIWFVIRCLLGKNGYKREYILVMMAFTGYFVNAMLEIVMYSECHMPAILLNLCMMPIFLSYNNKTTD